VGREARRKNKKRTMIPSGFKRLIPMPNPVATIQIILDDAGQINIQASQNVASNQVMAFGLLEKAKDAFREQAQQQLVVPAPGPLKLS
jgi:hypothetical protein